jgi:hypothetical protein
VNIIGNKEASKMPDWIDFMLVMIFSGAIGFLSGWKSRQPYVGSLEREYDHLMDEFEKICREHSALIADKH